MRATLNLPDPLIEELTHWTDQKNRTDAIRKAIEEYIRKKKIESLLSLQGKLDLEDNWREMEEVEMRDARGEKPIWKKP
jgi:metal-responsive CopG/Arc/MetJ family transcriptional regulator